MKTCNKCEKLLEYYNFYYTTLTEDGLSNLCKDCINNFNINNKSKFKICISCGQEKELKDYFLKAGKPGIRCKICYSIFRNKNNEKLKLKCEQNTNLNGKFCTKCKILKNLSDFSKSHSSPDGFNLQCKVCLNSKAKKSRKKTQKKHSNIESNITKICYECYIEKPFEAFSIDKLSPDGLLRRCRECCTKKQKDLIIECYRVLALEKGFSEPCCIWCKEHDITVLNIDHINNDGYKTRGTSGNWLYRKIIRNDLQQNINYQLLCANCNYIKKINDGVLPQNRFNLYNDFKSLEVNEIGSLLSNIWSNI